MDAMDATGGESGGSGEMVVRIHMEDQYRLTASEVAEIDKLDDALLAAIEGGDSAAFTTTLHSLLGYVRAHGTKVPVDELVPSDLIFPSDDMTLDEARDIMEKAAAHGQVTGSSGGAAPGA